ncbi:hypothetical protein GCK32_009883 [Trichostrongylus colubriformis]|uniref:Uncharacterized protein n=1 Tax=Trichostrongylus colubriformis TaxID=6319 RepID=A0AAN8IQ28_TRICO
MIAGLQRHQRAFSRNGDRGDSGKRQLGKQDDSPFNKNAGGSTAAAMLNQMRNGDDMEGRHKGDNGQGRKEDRKGDESSFKNGKNREQILQQVSVWVNRVLDMGAPALVTEFHMAQRPDKAMYSSFLHSDNYNSNIMSGVEIAHRARHAKQYLYVHRVLLAYFLEKYRSRFEHILENGGEEKYRQWCADYKKATGCD